MNIEEKFIELLGEPSSGEDLKKYIDFVINSEINGEIDDYCELHHIIPSCIFKNDLLYKLKYIDHVEAHYLLAKAYPIANIVRTLNFMLNRKEKESSEYRFILSLSIKDSWKKFRLTEKYQIWRQKRVDYCKNLYMNGKNKFISGIKTQETEARRILSLKLYWTEDKRKEKSESMIEFFKINSTQHISEYLIGRYKNKEFYDEFVITMTRVNQDPIKREKAGKKIKDKWESDPNYLEKMRKRRKRGSDGTKNRILWENEEFKLRQIKTRKLMRIKRNIKELDINISDLSDDEIIQKYEIYSRKINTDIPNTDLVKREEVNIIKSYKKKFKIKNDPLTGRGWYRISTIKLCEIIDVYKLKYGEL